jgi:hypothetical protein
VNVLDFPAVSFPAGFVDQGLDPAASAFPPFSQEDEIVSNSCEWPFPNASFSILTLRLQMCRRLEEEKALDLVKIIVQAHAQAQHANLH